MKKCVVVVIAILASFLGANMLSATPNTWTPMIDFGGTSRYTAVGFSIGSKGYLGTGYDDSSFYKDFWEYDPVANAWTQKANFGGSARGYAVGFSIGSKGYLGTGYDDSSFYKDFWEYDPVANAWTQKANFGGSARGYAVGFSIGSKGYLGTGWDDSFSETNDFWEYDATLNTWARKSNFGGSARDSAVGFSIGSKGYVGTGWDDSYPATKDFWEYNPTLNTWTQKADFGGIVRSYAAGFSIGRKGYIGTGWDGSLEMKDFWEYNPTLNAWAQKADFGGIARDSAVGFSIGRKGYILTGLDGSSSKKDLWEYDSGSFTDVPPTYWAYAHIMAIYDAGYTTGYGTGIFAPELTVTREQMSAFIIRAKEGEPATNYCSTGSPFADCSTGSWSCRYIKRLYDLGLTTGYGTTGLYMPALNVNRAQMAAFLVRAVEGEPAANYCSSGSPFTDVPTTDWACIYIKRLYDLGITTGYGDGRYGPDDLVTRAQMAVFLGRAFLEMD